MLCVVDSHIVGVSKPDPVIFVSAIEALGIDRDRIAYVGDSIRYDVRGATAAGLSPLLLDPYGDGASDGHERIVALTDCSTWSDGTSQSMSARAGAAMSGATCVARRRFSHRRRNPHPKQGGMPYRVLAARQCGGVAMRRRAERARIVERQRVGASRSEAAAATQTQNQVVHHGATGPRNMASAVASGAVAWVSTWPAAASVRSETPPR